VIKMSWEDVVKRVGPTRVRMFYNAKRRQSSTNEHLKRIERKLDELYKELEVLDGKDVADISDESLTDEMLEKLNLLGYVELELQSVSNALELGKTS
tara:strand:- start:865 stop:1155 length:291 start_codon:yes stop_codon:yes gene_type:complete